MFKKLFLNKEVERNNKNIKEIERLKATIAWHEKEALEISKKTRLEKEEKERTDKLKAEYEKDIKSIKAEKEELKIKDAIESKIADIRTENEVLKNENKLLRHAFDNMGFDVKDMKDILNKLVDGVVAKNEIKVIK